MSLPAGTRLGTFEIVRLLGAGGMGEVYLALDRQLDRPVAVKVLPAEVAMEPHRLGRFEQEARAASALSHPNICHIYHLGETPDRQRYIAMEYVDGDTLDGRLIATRVPLLEAVDIGIQIASALTAAHAGGIVHRDIKPQNVMIRRDRLVKVLDFGLAKLVPSAMAIPRDGPTQTAASNPGSVVGTTHYMSPEQARGREVDARTDIWALGVVLYEMVGGRGPFSGASRSDVLVAILDREPTPLARVNPEVPAELERIVGKALRKDPERRYQVMKDLLLDLEALRDELVSTDRSRVSAGASSAPSTQDLRPPLTITWGPGRLRSRKLVTVVAAATLLAALAGAAWWAWRPTMSRPAQTPAESAGRGNYPYTRLTFGPGLQTEPAFSPDGKFIAYASDRAGNFDIWVQALSGTSEPVQVTRSPADDVEPAWSPDGTTLVFRSERGGGLFLVPAFGGAERLLTSFGSHPVWSADGSEILFFAGRFAMFRRRDNYLRLHTVSFDGEPPRELLRDFLRDGLWTWAARHPDGRVSVMGRHRTRGPGFFTISRQGEPMTTSKTVPLGADPGALPFRFQWNAAGTMLYLEAAVKETHSLWRVKVHPATLDWLSAERLTTPAGRDVAPTLSRDGTRMVFSQQSEASRLWALPLDTVAGRPRVVGEGRWLTEEGAVASNPSLSPDGSKLAHELWRPGMDRSELWSIDIESGARELLAANARCAIWSRDGRKVAYQYFRKDQSPPAAAGAYRPPAAVAYRQMGGTERFLTPWSSKFYFVPTDWTRDGEAVLGTFLLFESGTWNSSTSVALWPTTSVALWPTSNPKAQQPERILLAPPPGTQLWCATMSPDARWILFTLLEVGENSVQPSLKLAVARPGTPPERWVRIASDHEWPDKPQWGADGKTIFFISKGSTAHLNLWAARFDPDRGQPIGKPFALTHFDSRNMAISPYIDSGLGISPRHAVLQMMTVTGSIWMLENVDR